MILDNSSEEKNVFKWFEKYIEQGNMDIVTGYFTVGALKKFAKTTNDKINDYRFILGDIDYEQKGHETLNLLNEKNDIKAAFELRDKSKDVVDFLNQQNVEVKTLEPNFCHAKLYLYKDFKNDFLNFYITGSSNLTEAGLGIDELKKVKNIELNLGESGKNYTFDDLIVWFKYLWENEKAKESIPDKANKNKKITVKQHLINEISKLFKNYSPNELYLKFLHEYVDPKSLLKKEDYAKILTKLENTEIYKKLYEFQRKGAISVIKRLEKYNGAILADAVGLGKTWTALAVMYYYQTQGWDTIVLCPKRLERYWKQFQKHHNSCFEKDQLDYKVFFHTDLTENRLQKLTEENGSTFVNKYPKLFVIDESHNFRNDKTERYKSLVEKILQKNDKEKVKVLMLSATPINNSFVDLRNQYRLMVQGQDNGFKEKFDITSMEHTFKEATTAQNKWVEKKKPNISDFLKELSPKLRDLLDELIVARTRKFVVTTEQTFTFPKQNKPKNVTGLYLEIGGCKTFEDLLKKLPSKFAAYMPAFYAERSNEEILKDESLRDESLMSMMHSLLIKRLESSWYAFKLTLERLFERHEEVSSAVNKYTKSKSSGVVINIDGSTYDDEDEDYTNIDEIFLEKKRQISVKEIDQKGNLYIYKKKLEKDINDIKSLIKDLNKIKPEQDNKLQKLIELIEDKQIKQNKKVLIFTVYADTAQYLFEQLSNGVAKFDRIAIVTGQYAKVKREDETKNYELILQRFAPIAKEKSDNGKPIDILISTDCLSEGQNLQDCDLVINYDIHWNPVRLIQRFGRIDRLGSPNKDITCVNFWPPDEMEEYLNLKYRVENRMVLMKVTGTEILEVTERIKDMAKDKKLEREQLKKMLDHMASSMEEIQDETSFKLGDISSEQFREDLEEEINKNPDYYRNLPNGIFSGFLEVSEKEAKEGLVLFLRYKHDSEQPPEFIHIDFEGNQIENNGNRILRLLKSHRKSIRYVPQEIDRCDKATVDKYIATINKWFETRIQVKIKEVTGGFISDTELIKPSGKKGELIEEMYISEKWNLVCWLVVSNNDKNN
jgi:superfamily II DNA or RNA helicase